MLGKPAIDFNHPEDAVGVIDRFRKLEPGAAAERQMRMRTRDGDYLWFAARTQKMPNGEYIGTLRDAGEQRAPA